MKNKIAIALAMISLGAFNSQLATVRAASGAVTNTRRLRSWLSLGKLGHSTRSLLACRQSQLEGPLLDITRHLSKYFLRLMFALIRELTIKIAFVCARTQ